MAEKTLELGQGLKLEIFTPDELKGPGWQPRCWAVFLTDSNGSEPTFISDCLRLGLKDIKIWIREYVNMSLIDSNSAAIEEELRLLSEEYQQTNPHRQPRTRKSQSRNW